MNTGNKDLAVMYDVLKEPFKEYRDTVTPKLIVGRMK
jgi:hypothetical protein